jgi:transposase
MSQNFIGCDREQVWLLPASLREWLPADHLAWFVLEAVGELDLSAFYGEYRADGHGRPAHDPAMMVALLVYAYAVGVRSARQVERRCVEDVAFRVIAANQVPDHATIARFRVRHQDALAGLFTSVLGLCAKAGLVSVGVICVDSTKLHANASGYRNLSYEQIAREILAEADAIDRAEDEQFGDARGDELPRELADPKTRRERLRRAKAELEAEHQAEVAAHQEMMARRAEHQAKTGRRPMGRPPTRVPPGAPVGRVNVTDPDSRLVKTPVGFIQGYNAQAVTNEHQIVIAAQVKSTNPDHAMLSPMVAAARAELDAVGVTQTPEVVLADAGYWSPTQVQTLTGQGMTVLVPPDGRARQGPPGKTRRSAPAQFMRRVLKSDTAREIYRQRQGQIEPVFGQIKTNRRADRFQRRGLPACQAEWRLITATHNLLKLWRHNTTLATA